MRSRALLLDFHVLNVFLPIPPSACRRCLALWRHYRRPKKLTAGQLWSPTALIKDGAGGAGVGRKPVEVFLRELFGGVSGGVDDADRLVSV